MNYHLMANPLLILQTLDYVKNQATMSKDTPNILDVNKTSTSVEVDWPATETLGGINKYWLWQWLMSFAGVDFDGDDINEFQATDKLTIRKIIERLSFMHANIKIKKEYRDGQVVSRALTALAFF